MNCMTDCPKIGSCCINFYLNANKKRVEAETPFKVLELYDETSVIATCPLLGTDGLCKEYDSRPDVCRDYTPATEPLCIMFCGPPQEGCLVITRKDLARKRRLHKFQPR